MLRATLEEAHRIYREPASRAQLATRMFAHFDRVFDLNGAAQRALGEAWRGRTPAERREYTRLFASLVTRSYLARMAAAVEGGGGFRIDYRSEAVQRDTATVRTAVVNKSGAAVPMTYDMALVGGRWMIRDVSMQDISLVENYRAQFRRILRDSSYRGLIDRMEVRAVDAAAAATAAPEPHEPRGPLAARPPRSAAATTGSRADLVEPDAIPSGGELQTP
jgi:phospholipid transport system substrate-binding protein